MHRLRFNRTKYELNTRYTIRYTLCIIQTERAYDKHYINCNNREILLDGHIVRNKRERTLFKIIALNILKNSKRIHFSITNF